MFALFHFLKKESVNRLSLSWAPQLAAGGDDGIRTHDPLLAGQVLSQLSYTPIGVENCLSAVLVLALTYLPAQSPVKYCRHS